MLFVVHLYKCLTHEFSLGKTTPQPFKKKLAHYCPGDATLRE